jgi:4-amino-4-deoxy-L-arabinose transferase-like glycosyltransferase
MPSPSEIAVRLDRVMTRRPLLVIAGYFLAHAVIRSALPVAPGYDDSAEFVRAQVLAGGYTAQPPLYTWLVWLIFQLTGPSLSALILLKNVLLFGTLALVWRIGRLVGLGERAAATGLFGVFLIVQVAWKSQFTLTHTVIAVFAAALMLERLLVLVERRRLVDYVAAGAVLGLGTMAKYNFPVLPIAFILALMLTADGRRAFLTWRSAVLVAVAALVLAPHALWVVGHADIATSNTGKLQLGSGGAARLKGGLSYLQTLISFAGPLLLVQAAIAWFGRGEGAREGVADGALVERRRSLAVAIGIIVVGAGAMVLASGATEVREHWLQPAFFVLPVLSAAYLARRVPVAALAWSQAAAAFVMLGILVAIPIACVLEPSAAGWRAVAQAIRAEVPDVATVVSNNLPNSGRLRWAAPDVAVLDDDMPKLPLATPAPAALMWATSEDAAPADLVALAAARLGKGVVGPTRVLTVPAWGARSKDKTVRVAGYTPG